MKLDELISNWISANKIGGSDLQGIEACNFGIFESTDGYTIYLTGSKEYDPEDDDWSTQIDYEPTNKYLLVPTGLTEHLDWMGVLELVENSLTAYVNSDTFANSELANITVITTGFDDGDLTRIK